MILPDRLSIIGGSAARHEFTAPTRLVSIVSLHAFGLVDRNGPTGPCIAGRRDQHVQPAEYRAHAVRRRLHLFQIAHVGADPQRVAAGLLDLQFRQVEFGLAARQQSDPRARLRESHREPFPDSASGAGDQHALVSNRH